MKSNKPAATGQGIYVNTGASDNEFRSNAIVNATELGININEGDDEGEDAGSNNVLLDNTLDNATLLSIHKDKMEKKKMKMKMKKMKKMILPIEIDKNIKRRYSDLILKP
jgi:hypothetical protein